MYNNNDAKKDIFINERIRWVGENMRYIKNYHTANFMNGTPYGNLSEEQEDFLYKQMKEKSISKEALKIIMCISFVAAIIFGFTYVEKGIVIQIWKTIQLCAVFIFIPALMYESVSENQAMRTALHRKSYLVYSHQIMDKSCYCNIVGPGRRGVKIGVKTGWLLKINNVNVKVNDVLYTYVSSGDEILVVILRENNKNYLALIPYLSSQQLEQLAEELNDKRKYF